jgi:hypothetical protein
MPPVVRVEVSADGGETWADAVLDEPGARFAWQGWRHELEVAPGEHVLCCRATDTEGRTQPSEPEWNYDGFCNNVVQRVRVVAGARDASA